MTAIFVTALILVAALLWLSLVTLPRWFVRSMHRHRIWRHRDQIVGEIFDGILPMHPAVWDLLRQVERTIDLASDATLLTFGWAALAESRMSPEARARFEERCREPLLDGLNEVQVKRICEHREQAMLLGGGLLLLGSWVGIMTTLLLLPAVAFGIGQERTPRSTSRIARATDEAIEHTRLGRVAMRAVPISVALEDIPFAFR